MPSVRLTITAIAGVAFVAGAAWFWRALDAGYIVAPWDKRTPAFCNGRVAREFPKFWKNISKRKLRPGEGYLISAAIDLGGRRLSVGLRDCKAGLDKRLTCTVSKEVPEARLKKGGAFDLDPATVTNWTYHRNFKFHHGCNVQKLVTINLAAQQCERAARKKFVDFTYAIETKNVDPQKHWIDVELEPAGSGRIWERLEARVNQCRRREDGRFACRIESAPPETGIAIGEWRVVDSEQVIGWVYTLDNRKIASCDGEDLSAYRQLNELRTKQTGDAAK